MRAPFRVALPVALALASGQAIGQLINPGMQPTAVQAVIAQTDANGNFSGAWATPFTSEPTSVHAAVYGQSSPFLCTIVTKSAIGFAGRCWALATMTLPSTVTAMQNLVLSPFQNAAANMVVTVTGRQ